MSRWMDEGAGRVPSRPVSAPGQEASGSDRSRGPSSSPGARRPSARRPSPVALADSLARSPADLGAADDGSVGGGRSREPGRERKGGSEGGGPSVEGGRREGVWGE